MPQLQLNLFGTFATTLNAISIKSFRSRKIQALLAYLAVESGRVHQRDSLIDLLWPEQPPKQARGSFRLSLSRLQKLIGNQEAVPPFLTITRQTLAWNLDSDYRLDVDDFLRTTDNLLSNEALSNNALNESGLTKALSQIQMAFDCYQGDFLAGFTVG